MLPVAVKDMLQPGNQVFAGKKPVVAFQIIIKTVFFKKLRQIAERFAADRMVIEHLVSDLDIASACADDSVKTDVGDMRVDFSGASSGAEVTEVSVFLCGMDRIDRRLRNIFLGFADNQRSVHVEEDNAFFHDFRPFFDKNDAKGLSIGIIARPADFGNRKPFSFLGNKKFGK